MIADEQLARYIRDGYAILEDVIPPASLADVHEAYEETIQAALRLGRAPRDETTGFLAKHRFQNPHHPSLVRTAVVEALCVPEIMELSRLVCGEEVAMHGIAAFAMNADFDYRGNWHRDSYFAWGKGFAVRAGNRELEVLPATQVLVALEEDASFWFVPGSHNRANTEEEERRFAEERTGWEELLPGAIQLRLRAGSAAPFDARGIHRGLKPSGVSRRSLFVVYGTAEFARESAISEWAMEAEYARWNYLDSLPGLFRQSVERTIATLREKSSTMEGTLDESSH